MSFVELFTRASGAMADKPTVVTPSNPLPVTLAAGTAAIGLVSASPSASTSVASTMSHPVTQVTKAVVKASAGNVFKFRATNETAADRWFQLHNKATAPAGTDVPVLSWKIPQGTAAVPGWLEFPFVFGKAFDTGISWAISTTQATFTDSATASQHEAFVEAK